MNENSENLQNVLKSGSFWKNPTKAVPGRPKPRKEIQNVIVQQNAKPASSFQNFQESVNDAWDIGEDEFCVAPNVEPIKALSAINNCKNKVVNNELLTNDKLLSKPNELQVTLSSKKNSQQTKPLSGQPEIHKRKTLTYLPLCEAGCENETGKSAKFLALLNSALLNLSELRQLSWSGIPSDIRPNTWRLLAGYLPVSLERRQETLERKRHDYWNFVKQYYNIKERDEIYQDTYRQIHIDIPRMSPVISLFQQKSVQEMFERILFIWAIRHPASGYVQGINDLVTPFFVVFLQEILRFNEDLNKVDISSLPKVYQDIIEADSFWCFSKFLEGIQDNYIFAQLGIQQKVNQLKELIQRIDCTLHKHLQDNGIDYLQFSFRWMNNLLTRELPLKCSIRLWDTYLCEADSFVSLHVYVCAAFLQHWRQKLLFEKDFQGLMMLLQHLPTQYWADAEIGVIIAEAYRLKYTFSDAPRHLQNGENSS